MKYCNMCGWQGKRFTDIYNYRMQKWCAVFCPRCHSRPRQRALFKYLQEHFLNVHLRCLEISPHGSNPVKKALKGIDYISIDFNKSHAMLSMDLTELTFADSIFDLIVCSHVLEHIEDDLAAISEIYRVLKKSGTALIQVPIGYHKDPSGKSTVEFSERRFSNHIRSYGWDVINRLGGAGRKVRIVRFTDDGLSIKQEVIFECRKYENC